jgi:hypothetical protein
MIFRESNNRIKVQKGLNFSWRMVNWTRHIVECIDQPNSNGSPLYLNGNIFVVLFEEDSVFDQNENDFVCWMEDPVFDLLKILEVIKTKRRICLSIWKIYSLSLVNNVSALALITTDFCCCLCFPCI